MRSSASPSVASGPMVTGFAVMASAARRPRTSSWSVSARRRSPSVTIPASVPSGKTTQAPPSGRRVMAMITSLSGASGGTAATSPMACIACRTDKRRLRPSCPPGWKRPNSSGVKPRAHIRAMARACPRASAVTALAVGARLCGSASRSTEASSSTSMRAASGDAALPRMPISGEWKSWSSGTSASSSVELPCFEISTVGSPGV